MPEKLPNVRDSDKVITQRGKTKTFHERGRRRQVVDCGNRTAIPHKQRVTTGNKNDTPPLPFQAWGGRPLSERNKAYLYLIMVGRSRESPQAMTRTSSGNPMGRSISGRNMPLFPISVHLHGEGGGKGQRRCEVGGGSSR